MKNEHQSAKLAETHRPCQKDTVRISCVVVDRMPKVQKVQSNARYVNQVGKKMRREGIIRTRPGCVKMHNRQCFFSYSPSIELGHYSAKSEVITHCSGEEGLCWLVGLLLSWNIAGRKLAAPGPTDRGGWRTLGLIMTVC